MKITHNKVGQNLSLKDNAKDVAGTASTEAKGKASAAAAPASAFSTTPATNVQLSSRAKDIQKAKQVVANTPDVDEAKVAKFQQLIDNGKYKVDSKGVADKMVDEFAAFGE